MATPKKLIYKDYLDQALHNFKVCTHLIKSFEKAHHESCNDWIVTTSYYSARNYLFAFSFRKPYKVTDTKQIKTFHNFNEYYNEYKHLEKGLHEVTCRLAEEVFGNDGKFLTDLHNESVTARYHDYKLDQETADRCYRNLIFIKGKCDSL